MEWQWLGIPMVLTALMMVLLWGLQREHRRSHAPEPVPAPADTAPPEHNRPFQYLSSTILQDRRHLRSLFGVDTPDLVLVCWATGEDPRQRASTYRQRFLPMGEGLQSFLRQLEEEFFEGTADQGVPDRSRLAAAYTFIYLPLRQQDMVVESRFVDDHFDHDFYTVDADGKLNRVRVRDEVLEERLVGRQWVEYRELLSTICSGNGTHETMDTLRAFGGEEQARANVHAWSAHFGTGMGASASEVNRHLSQAAEWKPGHLLGRLIRARREGQDSLRFAAQALKDGLPLYSDREAQTGFLLAQALRCLDQSVVARLLCESLLADWPQHAGAARLLRLIDQNERGAQT